LNAPSFLKMKYSIFFTLFIFFISCRTQEGKNEIDVFNNIKFVLKNSEIQKQVNPEVANLFQQYSSPLSIPLFRHISSNHYDIFLGIPYNTSFKKLLSANYKDQNRIVEARTDSATYFYKKFQTDTNFVSIYVIEEKNNLIFLLSTTHSQPLADSLFNYTELKNRIISNN
jgi:hypothetical protein